MSDNIEWQGVRVWITLFCVGGFHKEAVALGPDEKSAHVSYRWRA